MSVRVTAAGSLVLAAMVGAGVGLLGEGWRSSTGRALLLPPWSFAGTLLVLAVVLLLAGRPVRRRLRDERAKPLSPFYAVRVLAAAKAAALVGALCAGGAAGILIFFATLQLSPAPRFWVVVVIAVLSAGVLLVAGLVVESWCVLPPDDDEMERAAGSDVPA